MKGFYQFSSKRVSWSLISVIIPKVWLIWRYSTTVSVSVSVCIFLASNPFQYRWYLSSGRKGSEFATWRAGACFITWICSEGNIVLDESMVYSVFFWLGNLFTGSVQLVALFGWFCVSYTWVVIIHDACIPSDSKALLQFKFRKRDVSSINYMMQSNKMLYYADVKLMEFSDWKCASVIFCAAPSGFLLFNAMLFVHRLCILCRINFL